MSSAAVVIDALRIQVFFNRIRNNAFKKYNTNLEVILIDATMYICSLKEK